MERLCQETECQDMQRLSPSGSKLVAASRKEKTGNEEKEWHREPADLPACEPKFPGKGKMDENDRKAGDSLEKIDAVVSGSIGGNGHS